MSTSWRVAVCSRSFSRHPVLRAELLAQYPHVTFNDDGRDLRGEALVAFLDGHDAAITALERIDASVLHALPRLRVISKYGVGVDSLDLPALAARGVAVGWTSGVNRRSVSELVLAMAISVLRHVPAATREVQRGGWRQHVGGQLSGRTVGLIGCGHVGKDVVRLLQPFGCRILAHDIESYPVFYQRYGVVPVDLPTLLAESQVVSLHVPLDASTRLMIDGAALDRLRLDAILINAARGGLVDETALAERLADGRLAGAALDVLAVEPPGTHPLLTLPNVLLTPHLGGSAAEAILAMGRAAIAGLAHHRVPDGPMTSTTALETE